ncbi:xylulokinase [Microlunatus soli]|uniref:Xylulose kinase n=1 Tax=Microlunatus soli TaxID=630515 RepID=A0A1H1XK13_9ACTN|nr:xylulokinase [Microlunatus soli]SDT09522.1 D-xylulose kinase/2-phosphoglycolate phosphatase,TIGR01449 [Microlunatus soli]
MWMGIDAGTSACKVVVISEDGRVVAEATRDYPLQVPRPGWAEQDPEDWWQATDAAVSDVVGRVDPQRIAGIGLCGQMHGLTALDEHGEVLIPAILWNDQRCATECDEIVTAAGGLAALLQLTDNQMLPGYTAGKISWMRKHRPAEFARLRTVLNPKDFLRFKITGDRCTDVSDASGTGLFDVRRRRWSTELMRLIDLDPDLFPRVVESTEITGTILPELARRWGLAADTPVVGGGGDSVLQTTSMGIVGPGVQGVTLGTAGLVGAADTRCPDNPDGRLQISCGNAPGRWHVMGVSLNAGGSYAWLRSVLGELADGLDFTALNRAADAAPVGSEGLLFLPYLSGERAPHIAPTARGGWIGLTGRHRSDHLIRSVLEGVLLNLRQIGSMVTAAVGAPERILVSGGATGGRLWLQLLADVLGQPVRSVSGAEQGGAFGAALLAGVGTGAWPELDRALAVVTEQDPVRPNTEASTIYDRLSEVYQRLFPALEGTFDTLAGLELPTAGSVSAAAADDDRPVRTVIFDLDGTLVDTAADIARAVNVVLAEHGRPAQDPRFVEGFTGHGPTGLISGVYRAIGLQVDDDRLTRDVETYLRAARTSPVQESRLFADAAESLQALADRGIAIGICTNKTEDMARRVLTALGVDRFVGAIVGADTLDQHKPDPEHLLETIRRLGGDRSTSLYVGDSAVDLQTGDRAEVSTWLVDWSRIDDPDRRRIATFAEVVAATDMISSTPIPAAISPTAQGVVR